MSSAVVRWRFSPATTRSLRLLTYAAVGLTVGPVLGFVALVGATLVGSGGVDVALLVLVLALIVGVGVGSGRALFALGRAPPEVHESVRALSRWGVGGGVLLGMSLTLVGFRWTEFGLTVLVGSVVVGFVCLTIGAGLRTQGTVDRGEERVTYGGHAVPIAALRRVHAVTIGPFVPTLVAYHRGRVGPSTPRWFVFSVAAHDAIESVRESRDERNAEETETETEEANATPGAVRWVAAAFGVGSLLAGPVLWLVLAGENHYFATSLGLFATAFSLLFGFVFLRYAFVA